MLTKFGLAAIPVLLLLAIGLARVVRDKQLLLTSRAALVGYCGIAFVWMAVEAPFEDKGLGLALAMLLIIANMAPERQGGGVNGEIANRGKLRASAPQPQAPSSGS